MNGDDHFHWESAMCKGSREGVQLHLTLACMAS